MHLGESIRPSSWSLRRFSELQPVLYRYIGKYAFLLFLSCSRYCAGSSSHLGDGNCVEAKADTSFDMGMRGVFSEKCALFT